MKGYVLYRDNPYMAKSDFNGHFSIMKLPVGKHTFRLWHERVGYIRNVRIGPYTSDDRGRLTVMIKADKNQLETARLQPALFEQN